MSIELTLFGNIPDSLPATAGPATVYGHKANTDHGHLLIESEHGDWMFVWTGGSSLRAYFPGWLTGIDMTSEQLQVLGNYCLNMAERINR